MIMLMMLISPMFLFVCLILRKTIHVQVGPKRKSLGIPALTSQFKCFNIEMLFNGHEGGAGKNLVNKYG